MKINIFEQLLRKITLANLGIGQEVPGFNVSLPGFSCILLLQQRETIISEASDFRIERYVTESLMDELIDLGIRVDKTFGDIIRELLKEEYISIDSTEKYHAEKLSYVLVKLFKCVYPSISVFSLIAGLVQEMDAVENHKKQLSEALGEAEQMLKSKAVPVNLSEMSKGYQLGLKKITLMEETTMNFSGHAPESFNRIFLKRQKQRENSIHEIEKKIMEKGSLPVLPLNGKYLKQQIHRGYSSATELSEIILSDVAMTVNLLCSVNRNLPGKNVKTVSHAILLTGQEEMENLALGFKSLADVEDPDQRRELESAFIASYMSYTFSKYTARRMGIVDVEEICISSMIHNLGQMIVLYYYPEAYFEIKTLIRHGNTKRKAARKVMGTTYDTIGIHFARIWNFSFNTIESLRVCYFNRLGSTLDNLVINMPFCAAELCAYSGGVLGHKQKLRLRELVNAMNMFSRDISVLVNRSWSDVRLFCKKQKLTLDKREVSSIAATE